MEKGVIVSDGDAAEDRERRGDTPYVLNEQVGFKMRRANQRHTGIFSERMPAGLTPTQFAALAKLMEVGASSQNHLGRLTAMDAATIKGVVDRLRERGLVDVAADPEDRRRSVLRLSPKGRSLALEAVAAGREITEATLAPLDAAERAQLLTLLDKLG